MDRHLSLITPTGRLTLGDHLGALRRFVEAQTGRRSPATASSACPTCTPDDAAGPGRAEVDGRRDGHALPRRRPRSRTRHPVPAEPGAAHRELAYLLECTAYTGELNRMIEFKEKGRGVPSTRASLFTYPALMAADILLYRPSAVPSVTTRSARRAHPATSWSASPPYGPVSLVPEVTVPSAGAP